MLIKGEKYACEACVRGHRVSNCQHADRPLQHINKKVCHPVCCQWQNSNPIARRVVQSHNVLTVELYANLGQPMSVATAAAKRPMPGALVHMMGILRVSYS
jgi:hypothetical protein